MISEDTIHTASLDHFGDPILVPGEHEQHRNTAAERARARRRSRGINVTMLGLTTTDKTLSVIRQVNRWLDEAAFLDTFGTTNATAGG